MLPSEPMRFTFFLIFAANLLSGPLFQQRLNLFGRKKVTRHVNPVTGFSDHVYDRFGKKYNYTRIEASEQNNIAGKSFKSGWFNVFFAKGCGMDEDSSSLHNKRRKALFKVLSDVSEMLKIPETEKTFTGVSLLIDKLSSHLQDRHTNIPGLGSSFYAFPHLPSNPHPGVVDGMIYRTICTGNNAWPGDGNMLHGFIALNFDNAGIKWNLDTERDCAENETDLYTVCFRELMHGLGFTSLISADGSSVFGKDNNYYSRYDMFLMNAEMIPLISYSATTYPLYDLQFNVPVNILHSIDSAAKNGICFYDSVCKIPVCLSCPADGGSLLGYFCGSEKKKNEHGAMDCLNIQGCTARTLDSQERQVLCDLKYPLSDPFVKTGIRGYSPVSVQVWGCNDGIVQKEFVYKSEGGQIAIPKWGKSGILSNDSKTVIDASFIRNVYTESGYVANNPREIIFTPAAGFSGETILEYIPVDARGNYGNITFICVSVSKSKQERKSAEKK